MSTKKILYDYPSYVQAIENIRMQIFVTSERRSFPSGVSKHSFEPPNYNTNEFHSTTETYAIRNILSQAKDIDNLQRELKEYERVVNAIDIALTKLRKTDRIIIQMRYFLKPKPSWQEVAEKIYITDRHARRLENRAIQNLDIELRHIRLIR